MFSLQYEFFDGTVSQTIWENEHHKIHTRMVVLQCAGEYELLNSMNLKNFGRNTSTNAYSLFHVLQSVCEYAYAI